MVLVLSVGEHVTIESQKQILFEARVTGRVPDRVLRNQIDHLESRIHAKIRKLSYRTVQVHPTLRRFSSDLRYDCVLRCPMEASVRVERDIDR